MATYFVSSAGSATAPYDTWAKAATSLATALAAATSNGDIIVIDKAAIPSGDAEIGADATYTFAANVSLVSATNGGGSSYTPSAMGSGVWIGNSTTSWSVTFAGAFSVYIYGVTLRKAGGGSEFINIASTDGCSHIMEGCRFWNGTASSDRLVIGNGGTSTNSYCRLINSEIVFGQASQSLSVRGAVEIIGGVVSGTQPTTTYIRSESNNSRIDFIGHDISLLGATPLINSANSCPVKVTLDRCKLGASYVLLGAQSPANEGLAHVEARDCSSGDTHGIYEYHNPLGSMTIDSSIYYTSGAAAKSWKIVTSSAASKQVPFCTPWIAKYNSTLSSQTPTLEILRDGSSTAYTDAEVWAEVMAKTISGETTAVRSTDGIAIGATPANQAAGAGLGSWTGESGTAWSGKIDSGSAITPAEVGDITMRVCVGAASSTVYVNPEF